MSGVEIVGLGAYTPAARVENAVIESRLGLEAGWIKRRTGIEARCYAADDEALSDLAIKAGKQALSAAKIARQDVALLLLATSTPDHLLPPTAPLVADKLKLSAAGGIDLAGACGGFLYALALAESFTRAHQAPVLVIAANILSRRINTADRATSVLFGDAAGAALLAPTSRREAGAVGVTLASAGAHYDLIKIPGGGSRKPFASLADAHETLMIISSGQTVYHEAVEMMATCSQSALAKAKATASAVTHFIPHQANARMMATVARKVGVPEKRMLSTIADCGNSSAATIPLTLARCAPHGGYAQGDLLLMTAAGAGLTGGAIAWRV